MTATAHGSGAWQRSQFSHSHGVTRCKSPRVVFAWGGFMGKHSTLDKCAESSH
jgi:hypothetical protein